MTKAPSVTLSVVIPLFNEEAALPLFHQALGAVLDGKLDGLSYEVIYCDDGSTDGSPQLLTELATKHPAVSVVRLSRNFGKEMATTAGIRQARGQAIITIDSDGQHPVELIPELVKRWQAGNKVVIGVRTRNQKEGLVKRLGSRWFYRTLARFSSVEVVPGATDFRIIDRQVQQLFNQLTEHNRISRGLIDWLGFKRDYLEFTAHARQHGEASYSFIKLCKLAIDSLVSLSSTPLYLTAVIGAIILPLATLLGLFMAVNALLGDPAGLHATGGAYLLVLILFLSGLLLMTQGIVGLYVSHIHSETQNRPLYIVDEAASTRLHA